MYHLNFERIWIADNPLCCLTSNQIPRAPNPNILYYQTEEQVSISLPKRQMAQLVSLISTEYLTGLMPILLQICLCGNKMIWLTLDYALFSLSILWMTNLSPRDVRSLFQDEAASDIIDRTSSFALLCSPKL